MKIETWLLVIILVTAIFRTQRRVRSARSVAERFFVIRASLFTWVLGFIFLVALLFLPNKPRLLLMIPIFVAAVTLGKLWRRGRERFRGEAQEKDHFARAKRIN